MNRSSAALVALLLLISGQLFAKAPTSKTTLEDITRIRDLRH